jgi:N-acetylated-alpha-linked acidic dipeptidase
LEKEAARIRPLLFDPEKVQKTDPDILRHINRLLISLERDFTDPAGIPRRPWYKHLIFGARYTYAVLLLPALTEASEAGDEKGVAAAIRNLEKAVAASTAKLEKIRALWKD